MRDCCKSGETCQRVGRSGCPGKAPELSPPTLEEFGREVRGLLGVGRERWEEKSPKAKESVVAEKRW